MIEVGEQLKVFLDLLNLSSEFLSVELARKVCRTIVRLSWSGLQEVRK